MKFKLHYTHDFGKYKDVEINTLEELLKLVKKEECGIIVEYKDENKKLKDYADNLDSENDNQAIEIEELKKENKKLKMSEKRYKNQYDFDEECLRKIEEEIEKLKRD